MDKHTLLIGTYDGCLMRGGLGGWKGEGIKYKLAVTQ